MPDCSLALATPGFGAAAPKRYRRCAGASRSSNCEYRSRRSLIYGAWITSKHSDLVEELSAWLANSRADAAAASKARERWLRQQLAEEATFAGVLLDLAERESMVVVSCVTGRRHRCQVQAVADDFCAVRTANGGDSLLSLESIASVQPTDDAPMLVGSRPAALAMALSDAMAALLVDRPRVLIVAFDGSGTAGELRSVGQDLVVLRPEGEPKAIYLPVNNIAEVTISG